MLQKTKSILIKSLMLLCVVCCAVALAFGLAGCSEGATLSGSDDVVVTDFSLDGNVLTVTWSDGTKKEFTISSGDSGYVNHDPVAHANDMTYWTLQTGTVKKDASGEWVVDQPEIYLEDCSACYYTEIVTATEVDDIHHNYPETGDVTDPTCTEDGYTRYECQDDGCEYYYDDDIVPATGHTVSEFTVDTPYPTETITGTMSGTCVNENNGSTCGTSVTVVLPTLEEGLADGTYTREFTSGEVGCGDNEGNPEYSYTYTVHLDKLVDEDGCLTGYETEDSTKTEIKINLGENATNPVFTTDAVEGFQYHQVHVESTEYRVYVSKDNGIRVTSTDGETVYYDFGDVIYEGGVLDELIKLFIEQEDYSCSSPAQAYIVCDTCQTSIYFQYQLAHSHGDEEPVAEATNAHPAVYECENCGELYFDSSSWTVDHSWAVTNVTSSTVGTETTYSVEFTCSDCSGTFNVAIPSTSVIDEKDEETGNTTYTLTTSVSATPEITISWTSEDGTQSVTGTVDVSVTFSSGDVNFTLDSTGAFVAPESGD